ncbi:MAG TPA: hypothetical protein VMW77_09720, partial [Methanoregula sp.]|nr:hypothetical protein [Methanoregula sp.]
TIVSPLPALLIAVCIESPGLIVYTAALAVITNVAIIRRSTKMAERHPKHDNLRFVDIPSSSIEMSKMRCVHTVTGDNTMLSALMTSIETVTHFSNVGNYSWRLYNIYAKHRCQAQAGK